MATKRTTAPSKTKVDAPKTAAPAPAGRAPSFDAIQARAYALWRAEGCAHGQDQAHWFQAERELRVTR